MLCVTSLSPSPTEHTLNSGHLGGSVVEHLPLAQGVILESWDGVPHRAPCRDPASPSAYVSDPLSHNSAEGKERPRVHRQTLGAGLQAAARKPTNLAKVYDVRPGKDESPAAFLEQVIEAFRQYTPMNPEAPETKAAIIMAFVNQAAPDIKTKLQRVERLGEKSLQDLVIVAERVYNNRESPEEQQTKLSDRQTRNLAKILLATTMDDPQERRRHLKKLASGTGKEDGPGPPRECPKLNKNQCAY
ncbi:unnamed protein product [Nyctereutes procyonoides]|uniref:(raccoon dog) hypothetical protein n=1 Tax=Nyctereutes procyonoides TaxID=34880 RepID=A0A811YWU6_NYCPR|nr:unnamed protein product [Nyctereutes procyonoides]